MKSRWQGIALFGLLALQAIGSAPAAGDSVSFNKVLSEQYYAFGDIEFVRIYDGRGRRPTWRVEVFRGGRRIATHPNASFEDIFANGANDLFVGISNFGIPGTALVQFDDDGNMLDWMDHSSLPTCGESVTVLRNWYADERPQVVFEYTPTGADAYATDVRVLLCDGKTFFTASTVERKGQPPSQVRAPARPPLPPELDGWEWKSKVDDVVRYTDPGRRGVAQACEQRRGRARCRAARERW